MLFLAQEMALQLHVHAPGKQRGEAVQLAARRVEAARVARRQRARHDALLAARQNVQPLRVRGDFLPRRGRLPLRLSRGGGGEEQAEVLVALLVLGEQRQAGKEKFLGRGGGRGGGTWLSPSKTTPPHESRMHLEDHLRADQRLDARRLRRLPEARGAGDAVRVDERDGGRSSAAARSTRSSGSDDPFRNENAEATRSSAYGLARFAGTGGRSNARTRAFSLRAPGPLGCRPHPP